MSTPVVLRLPFVTFTKKHCDVEDDVGIKVCPIIVDFERLLKGGHKNYEKIIPGVPNTDLLHVAASLYGVTLSEVTDDIIYPTMCGKWSRTLLMLRDEEQSLQHLMKTTHKRIATNVNPTPNDASNDSDDAPNIFSDDESSDEDEDFDDDFVSGIPGFLAEVQTRKEHLAQLHEKKIDRADEYRKYLGVEHRLIGCSTFERSYEKPGQRVLQLTLVGVRKKYRGVGVGGFMMKQLHDATITGGYDVIVVNADHNAVDFFEKEGFSDDVILNSQYSDIGDVWLNCKRMCYLPSYGATNETTDLDLKEMELELAMWREKSLNVYQSQASLFHRLRREIVRLRARASMQDDVISRLQADLEVARDSGVTRKEEELRKRLENIRVAVDDLDDQIDSSAEDFTSNEDNGCLLVDELRHCFITNMDGGEFNFRGTSVQTTSVDDVIIASVPNHVIARFNDSMENSLDRDIVTNLYYSPDQSGSSDNFDKILKSGFSESDFVGGCFGRGLHFTRHARAATRFSPPGVVLVAKVALGRTQTVTTKDPCRVSPPEGSNSILTQGRLSDDSILGHPSWTTGHSEYLVFNPDQVLPIAVVKYSSHC
ncbi:uncharacterized protein LOC100181199 [Ciona intestinalis]